MTSMVLMLEIVFFLMAIRKNTISNIKTIDVIAYLFYNADIRVSKRDRLVQFRINRVKGSKNTIRSSFL